MWSIALKLSILNRKSVYASNSTCCSDLFREAKTIQSGGVAWGFSGLDWTKLCQKSKLISELWFTQLGGASDSDLDSGHHLVIASFTLSLLSDIEQNINIS